MHFTKGATPNIILIASCLLLIVAAPLVPPPSDRMVFIFLYLLIFISALFAMGVSRLTLILVGITFTIQILSAVFEFSVLEAISPIVNLIFFAFVVIQLVLIIASKKEVTTLVILDAISAYLLIGIIFFMLNLIITRYFPDALSGSEGSVLGFGEIIYYTFVTYTTLGYGDISPANSLTRSLASLSAICGQVYLTIVIALIVGKYLARQR